MSQTTFLNEAFHFPSLVWGASIAIYLFLLGISAGATMMAILLKRSRLIEGEVGAHPLVKTNAWLAPLAIVVGLVLLIFHLARPWTFWYLMFHYSLSSIMAWGVIMFQLYFACLFLWLVHIYEKPLRSLPRMRGVIDVVITLAHRLQCPVELILLLVSLALSAYTGFLLSALISYPMLNNPVLPVLFLASGTSSGIAALTLGAFAFTQITPHNVALHWLHKIEFWVLIAELFLLFAFFYGLYLGGGQKTVAFFTALGSGFWASVFWIGVLGIGILLPLALTYFGRLEWKQRRTTMCFLSSCILLGVFCLRFFILYAGQMTLY